MHKEWRISAISEILLELGLMESKFVVILLVLFGASNRPAIVGSLPSTLCYTWNSSCVGGDATLGNVGVAVTYRYQFCSERNALVNQTGLVIARTRLGEECTYYLIHEYEEPEYCNDLSRVEYDFEQREHGGGECNCVQICFDCNCQGNNSE